MTKQQQTSQTSKDQKANQEQILLSNQQQSHQTPQIQQKRKADVEAKKKIIKKFPFNFKATSNQTSDSKHDEDLKDWKPVSLHVSKTGSSSIRQDAPKKRNQIFNQFLINLPKPKQKDIEEDSINMIAQNGGKKSHKQIYIKQTEEQLKWDAEDEFLTKNAQNYHLKNIEEKVEGHFSLGQNVIHEEVEDNEIVDKIVWLNEVKKDRNTNIADIVAKTWQKQQHFPDDDGSDSDQKEQKKKKPFVKSGNPLFKSKPF